jgi:hypothetical protein
MRPRKWLPRELRVIAQGTAKELEAELRKVPLKGNSNVTPYSAAQISIQKLSRADVRPLSLYALEENIEVQRRVHNLLEASGAPNSFTLTGILVVADQEGTSFRIAPPVVERLPENEGGGLVLVDGIHRFMAADRLGIQSVNAVLLEHVSVPLVPLPVEWNDVRIYAPSTGPSDADKRRYRFETFEAFPVREYPGATPANFRYYLYRDLSALGSEGIRSFTE